jgi:hypothetical protein
MLYKRITSSWRPRRPITGQISLCPPISIIPNTAERLRSVPSTKTQQELRQVTATKPGVFQVEAIRQHLHSKKYHGAGDLTGIQMREKMYVLFETDDSDEELHSLLFTYCMYYSSSTSGSIRAWILLILLVTFLLSTCSCFTSFLVQWLRTRIETNCCMTMPVFSEQINLCHHPDSEPRSSYPSVWGDRSTPRYKLAIQSDQARLAYSFDWRRWSRWRRRMMSPICHESCLLVLFYWFMVRFMVQV